MIRINKSQQDLICKLKLLGLYISEHKHFGGLVVYGGLDGVNIALQQVPQLENVTSVELMLSDIADDGFAAICSLPKLKSLHINSERITAEGFALISQLQQLEVLEAIISFSGDVAAASIGCLLNLRNLRIPGSELTGEGLRHIANCAAIEELDVSGNAITDGFGVLQKCGKLTALIVDNCPINAAGIHEIASLSQLESVNFRECPINDELVTALLKMDRLKTLSLTYCPITSRSLETIGKMTSLESLYWASTALDSNHLHYFAQLPNLRNLLIDLNPGASPKMLKMLRKLLPDCEIVG